MSSSETGETILVTRTNITYQTLDKELTGKVHRVRARDFARQCPAQDYITPIYLETASPAAKEYIARLAYIRLLTDYDWEPTERILLFIGSIPKDQEELLQTCPGITSLHLAALITLWEDVFPDWNPNKEQRAVRNQEREAVNDLQRCDVCTLIKGSYCNAPVTRNSPPCPTPTAPRNFKGSKNIRKNTKRN